ncbi:hypothetical protein Clacol_007122 [Clathrus columnatus]|uniref:F-box domain-containing protein n=1 Tax=Clathrus columnatus TaxID=1419009 RepID=A0AAV5AK94_9AGAM|nr:hypothetical protein Clacol_007122 [Clathrus columnatus]
MSTQWITRFPLEILFLTIGAINDRNDLLSFALTCRFIYQLIIPDKLKHFRISSLIKNFDLWNHLLQNLHLCRGSHEFELTDGARIPHARQRSRIHNDPKYMTIVSNSLPQIIRNMVNLSRVKFSWRNTDFEIFRNLLDALGDSSCKLEEFDLFLDIPRPSRNSTLMTEVMKLENLQIWTKLDRTALQKISIRVGTSWSRTSVSLHQANWVGDMLSDTPKLTHLSLTIQHTKLSVNILDYTWPNLENFVINNHSIFPTPVGVVDVQPPSKFIDFFKRHPKLTTLSLPWFVYPRSLFPYITVECLPNLESFAYDGEPRSPLSKVLSPASARRLRHLTIRDNALGCSNNLEIYKELTSLQTFSFTLNPLATNHSNTTLNPILEVLAMHATDLQKIHLPTFGVLSEISYAALSFLQRFPKLTYLSGIWAYDINDHDLLLQALYQCRQLEYAIYLGNDNTCRVFRLIREFEQEDKDERISVEVVSGKNLDFDMRTWGNFYNKVL